jgi:hypothetical protein
MLIVDRLVRLVFLSLLDFDFGDEGAVFVSLGDEGSVASVDEGAIFSVLSDEGSFASVDSN